MKWWPQPPRMGDMIRVRVGSVYHFGIYVSDGEVIQFGPPPSAENAPFMKDFTVIATSVEDFSASGIPETAIPETRSEKRRFSAQKTVKLAREAIGRGGYDLLRNNCEHFVTECVYGRHESEQEAEARRRWHSRPLLSVYLTETRDEEVIEKLYPSLRDREIKTARVTVKSQKYAAWRALEQGLLHALGLSMRELKFKRDRFGKWTCDRCFFSIAHTKGFVAVAVSDAPVGVDLENLPDFVARHGERLPSLLASSDRLSDTERALASEPSGFLYLWTRTEALFKCRGKGRFDHALFPSDAPDVRTLTPDGDTPLILSLAGERTGLASFYLLGSEGPCRLTTNEWEPNRL